ncbi:MAG: lysophospholipid acyltransferase family protein [Acidobacteriaceae bacterium]
MPRPGGEVETGFTPEAAERCAGPTGPIGSDDLGPVWPGPALPNPVPPPHQAFFRWLTYLVLIPLFLLATAAFGSIALIASLFDGSGRVQHLIAKTWGGVLLWIAFSRVRLVGEENFQRSQAAVYVSNHLSYMDTPVVLSKLPFQFRILARHDLFTTPFIGWYLQRSGQIPVDSTSLRSTLASLNRGVKALQAGMPLVIFPEGGRAPDGCLQDFLSGPAYMAIRAHVPIVPMALIGTYELMPMHTYHLTPRPLLLVVGAPISTAGYTSKTADALTRRVRDQISEMYLRHAGATSSHIGDRAADHRCQRHSD